MIRCRKLAGLSAALVAALFAITGSAEARKCVMAGGKGTGITNQVAGYMAKSALQQSIRKSGMKARGKIKLKCKYEFVISTCTAKQRACKK